jgi:hypothetical protein
MKKKWMIVLVIVIVLVTNILWFASSTCGKDKGYGAFEKTRCKCAGFIGEDIFEIPMFDSTTDYRCYGIKIGRNKLVSMDYDYHLIDLNMEIKSIKTEYGSMRMIDLPPYGNICLYEPNQICFDEKCQTITNFTLENKELCLDEGEYKVIIEGKGSHTLITKSK